MYSICKRPFIDNQLQFWGVVFGNYSVSTYRYNIQAILKGWIM